MAMALNRFDFKGAVDWLAQHFAGAALSQRPPSIQASPLKLPSPDGSQLERVKAYLVRRRGIAAALVESLIKSGAVYADTRCNAVFIMRGEGGIAVGAELRGTTELSWRGLAPGSRKDLGFFSVPPFRPAAPSEQRRALILCESAIDAISCYSLHSGFCCISTAGARPCPAWLRELIEGNLEVHCGFDADPTGDDMAHSMIQLHPAVQRLRPPDHDWNDTLRSHSSGSSIKPNREE